MAEHILIFYITGSQHHNLYRILTKFIHHIIHQIKSFLICKTGHHTDQHYMRIFVQSQFFLKSCLIHWFVLPEIINAKVPGNSSVRFRIPVVIIQSVYNTAQIICPCRHKAVQSFSVKRGLDFFCVTIADGRHLIRINDTSL